MFSSSPDPEQNERGESLPRLRELEQAVALRDQLLRSLTGLASGVAWTADSGNRILSLTGTIPEVGSSPTVAHLFGAAQDAPGDFPALRASREALRGKPSDFTVQVAGIAYRGRIEPIWSQSGAVVGTSGTAAPLSFAGTAFIDQSPLGMEVFALDGSLKYANPAW